jgi:hypothetical protein
MYNLHVQFLFSIIHILELSLYKLHDCQATERRWIYIALALENRLSSLINQTRERQREQQKAKYMILRKIFI